MKKEKILEWKTEQRKVKDLLPLEINPRKISEEKKVKLIRSLEKFNLAEIPAVNTDNKIIGGNQRVAALLFVGRGDELIDVRVPNRKLTDKEVKEYAIISNTHAGEFDFEILELEFADIEIAEIGFDIVGWEDWNKLNAENFGNDFTLPSGEKAPFQQMTFILADEQAEQIKQAIEKIKVTDEYKYCETMGNQNTNGNALYLMTMQWAGQKK